MPKIQFTPGIVTAGVKIGHDSKVYVDRPRQNVYNKSSQNTARVTTANRLILRFIIQAKDYLIDSFLSGMARFCSTDNERRELIRQLARKAGHEDLLAAEPFSRAEIGMTNLQQLILHGPPDLTANPPSKWHDKPKDETLESFVKREYGQWIGKGLVQADIRRYDPQLYSAMMNWQNRSGGKISVDLGIPPKKKMTERLLKEENGAMDPVIETASRWKNRIRSRNRRAQQSENGV